MVHASALENTTEGNHSQQTKELAPKSSSIGFTIDQQKSLLYLIQQSPTPQ